METILIAGGGFAGVWAALAAAELRATSGAEQRLRIQLVSAGDDLVIRPRLYEADPASKTVPLDTVLTPVGVHRLRGQVTGVDTAGRRLLVLGDGGAERRLDYDRLILATGSQLLRPNVPGADGIHDVDTVEAADRLERHLLGLAGRPERPGRFTAVVVGAGFTGVEVATELRERLRAVAGGHADRVRVVLVERGGTLLPGLGDEIAAVARQALEDLGVDLVAGTSIAGYDGATLTLSTGERLPAATVVWTAGLTASPLTRAIGTELDQLGRLAVDAQQRVRDVPGVYAAGDVAAAIAEDGHVVTQSCQHAMPQGSTAGRNAAADLLGLPLVDFAPHPYATCLDLGAAGAVRTIGWDRQVTMTGAEAKALKQEITGVWIYPPVSAPATAAESR